MVREVENKPILGRLSAALFIGLGMIINAKIACCVWRLTARTL
jgi:hypothetical protein